MQMPGSVLRVRSWFAGFGSRPVVLVSPLPVGECHRRLAVVTTGRGVSSWHLDPHNASRSSPRFRGSVTTSRISVARFEDTAGRNSFAPWLDARLETSATGQTTLTGSIGLHPAPRVLVPVIAAVASLIALGAVAGGIALMVSGHISRSLPAVVIPLALIALLVAFNVAGLRALEQSIPKLVHEMNATLGASAVLQDPPTVQSAATTYEAGLLFKPSGGSPRGSTFAEWPQPR